MHSKEVSILAGPGLGEMWSEIQPVQDEQVSIICTPRGSDIWQYTVCKLAALFQNTK